MYSDWFFTSLCWCSSWVRGGREGCPGICAVNITTRMPRGYRSYYTQMHTKVLRVFVLPLIVNYTSNKLYTVIMYLFSLSQVASVFFWVLFFMDREFIYPSFMEEYIPANGLLNHIWVCT